MLVLNGGQKKSKGELRETLLVRRPSQLLFYSEESTNQTRATAQNMSLILIGG